MTCTYCGGDDHTRHCKDCGRAARGEVCECLPQVTSVRRDVPLQSDRAPFCLTVAQVVRSGRYNLQGRNLQWREGDQHFDCPLSDEELSEFHRLHNEVIENHKAGNISHTVIPQYADYYDPRTGTHVRTKTGVDVEHIEVDLLV